MRKIIFVLTLLTIPMAPTKVLATTTGSCPQYEPLLRKYGLPVKQFSKIAFRESRCNPRSISAVRPSTGKPDVGLLMVQGSWATVTRNICHVQYQQVITALTNVNCNLAVSAYLYSNGGIGHWRATSGN